MIFKLLKYEEQYKMLKQYKMLNTPSVLKYSSLVFLAHIFKFFDLDPSLSNYPWPLSNRFPHLLQMSSDLSHSSHQFTAVSGIQTFPIARTRSRVFIPDSQEAQNIFIRPHSTQNKFPWSSANDDDIAPLATTEPFFNHKVDQPSQVLQEPDTLSELPAYSLDVEVEREVVYRPLTSLSCENMNSSITEAKLGKALEEFPQPNYSLVIPSAGERCHRFEDVNLAFAMIVQNPEKSLTEPPASLNKPYLDVPASLVPMKS